MKIQVIYGDHPLFCSRCGVKRRKGSSACSPCGFREVRGGRAYTYSVPESLQKGLKTGMKVIVPGNWVVPGEQVATVVALNSEYTGQTVSIVSVIA
jgi:ribosomal protein L37E